MCLKRCAHIQAWCGQVSAKSVHLSEALHPRMGMMRAWCGQVPAKSVNVSEALHSLVGMVLAGGQGAQPGLDRQPSHGPQ